jgi:hypothetical protein
MILESEKANKWEKASFLPQEYRSPTEFKMEVDLNTVARLTVCYQY